jgi:hypothetical protein
MPPTIVDARLPDSLAGVNFAYGRGECPYPIDVVVLHCTEGDAASVRAWFKNPASQVSAHYMVTKLGAVVQFVAEADKAFHAGQLVSPSAAIVVDRYQHGKWTPNSYGIGIECESSGVEELTDRQRAALYGLLRDIIRRRGIPVDLGHIIGHHAIKASKTCPGGISVARIVADLSQAAAAPSSATEPPADRRVVWSSILNDYVVVVRYVDDRTWYYRTLKSLDTDDAKRAGAPLSAFPLTRPIA